MPCTKVLHPSLCELPITSLCLSSRMWTASKPHCRRGIASSCYVGRSLSSPLNHCDAGAKHPTTTPRASPLLPPSLLTSCAAPSSLQLPSLTPHSHGVLAHAHLPLGPVQRHPLASSPEPMTYEQTPSASPPRKAASTVTSLLCLVARVSTPALPSR
jgi:hypothetical protein